MKNLKTRRKVTIRTKPISNGRSSLFLDYYPPIPHPETGKLIRKEYLKRFLIDRPRTPIEKQHNTEARIYAEERRAEKQIMYAIVENDSLHIQPSSIFLIDYYKALATKRGGSNGANWQSSQYYVEQFFDEGTKLTELTAKACNAYRDYLLTAPSQRKAKANLKTVPISQNTAQSYYNKLKVVLKEAYKDGIIKADLNAQAQPIKDKETQRQFLTLEELQRLAKTDCSVPELKRAGLFSALTGLRFSDIAKLTWSEIHHSQQDGYSLQFIQKKTKGVEVLPISETAAKLLGDRGNPADKVFSLKVVQYYAKHLADWIQQAGITKHITFHCFRHTYATLQIASGTDLYTVSKLLGHRDISTTQIYAKVMDKAKQEAANKINIDL